MNSPEQNTDPKDVAQNLTEYEDELRDCHGPPVVETDSVMIFADYHGHELSEIAKLDMADFDELYEWMHTEARKHRDRTENGGDAWAVADPVVVLKD